MRRAIACCAACLALAGCSDPMSGVTRLSDVDLDDQARTVEVAEPASEAEQQARGGLFARLFSPKTTAPDAPAQDVAAEDQTGQGGASPDATDSATADAQTARPRRGLFGLFARNTQAQGAAGDEDAAQQARLGAVNRRNATDPDAPDARLVAPGTVLPYGEVARVCDLPTRDLGSEVARYPERRPQYRVYDSVPGSTTPRVFYVTGFPDGCARQFTAAMAMFASPAMHEQLRYGAPAESLPYSDTDKAYDQIKRRVCGVGRNKPCGSRIGQLERDTAFVTVYERFGSNARWATILLHDGQVVARDTKSGG